MPIYLIYETVPISEIELWKAEYRTEYERYEKIDWYLAQIAGEIRYSMTKKRSWNVKDMLLKFVKPKPPMTAAEAKKLVVDWVFGLAAVGKRAKRKK